MDTWTLQAGFPLIQVTLQDGHVTASQARFVVCEENVTDPNEPFNSTLGYRWHVPLTYITNEQPDEYSMYWMNLTDGKAKCFNQFYSNIYKDYHVYCLSSYVVQRFMLALAVNSLLTSVVLYGKETVE